LKYALYKNPSVTEFLMVLSRLPEDEIEQYEAFTGETFNFERVASIYSLREGPSWVVVIDDRPRVIAGFDQLRPGVWQDWMFSTTEVWTDYWRTVTKVARRVMDAMVDQGAHRLQCVSLASRIHAHRWYRPLGLQLEGTLRGFGVNGEDALMFARLRIPDGQ
jgi:hypothetical protein